MKSSWKKIKRQLTLPFFTPTIDSFITLGFAIAGAMAGSYMRGIIPLWQLLLYAVIFLIIITPILRNIGNNWREKKGIEEKDLKPNKLVDRVVLNVLLGFSIVCFVIALIINYCYKLVLVDCLFSQCQDFLFYKKYFLFC